MTYDLSLKFRQQAMFMRKWEWKGLADKENNMSKVWVIDNM